MRWNSDGTPNGAGDATGGPTTWTTTWQLGPPAAGVDPVTSPSNWATTQYDAATTVLDGTYTAPRQAFNDLGIAGDSRAAVLPLNRSLPITVTGFEAGRNFNVSKVEFRWNQNPELDIIGYEVYELGPRQRARQRQRHARVPDGQRGRHELHGRRCPRATRPTTSSRSTAPTSRTRAARCARSQYAQIQYDHLDRARPPEHAARPPGS